MKDRNFLFSVIMPIYNVEMYLEESILSVINQTIGFKENIQLILVNDGSRDKSGDICEKYKELYPENIIYTMQYNRGVSVARNRGMEKATGKYLNFLDPDDIWQSDAFEKIYDFFEKHYDETDVVTTKINRFGLVTSDYRLNYRLEKGSRVADLTDKSEHKSVVVQVASSFFKAEALDGMSFIPNLKVGEDSMFVNSVIMKRMRVGFVTDAVYMYRKREDETSALQTSKKTDYFYIDRLSEYHLALINKALEQFEAVPKYIQNVVYYDFGWHLAMPVNKQLSPKKYGEFLTLCKKVLRHIDNGVICRNRVHTSFNKKNAALSIKYGVEKWQGMYRYDPEKGAICFKKSSLLKPCNSKTMLTVTYCGIAEEKLIIQGLSAAWLYAATDDKVSLVFKAGEKEYKAALSQDEVGWTVNCFGSSRQYLKYTCSIPLKDFKENTEISVTPFLYFGEHQSGVGMNYTCVLNCGEMIYKFPKIVDGCTLNFAEDSILLTKDSDADTIRRTNASISDTVKAEFGESALEFRNKLMAYKQKKLQKKRFVLISPAITDSENLLKTFMAKHYAKNDFKYIFLTNGNNKQKLHHKRLLASHKKLPLYWLRADLLFCTEEELGSFEINGESTAFLWDVADIKPQIID